MPLPDKEILKNNESVMPDPTRQQMTIPSIGIQSFVPNMPASNTTDANSSENLYNKLLSLGSPVNKTPGFNIGSTFSFEPSEVDRSGRYDRWLLGVDNENLQGELQSNWDKAANALLKGTSLAVTTFVQSTIGLLNGVGSAIADGRLASFYDNPMNRALDEFNKNLENSMPNYYTNKEKNAEWYSPDNWFSANFVFDKLIKNLGFTAGAALSGMGYASLLGRISTLSKAMSVGKTAEALAATEEAVLAAAPTIERGGTIVNKLTQLSKELTGTYSRLNQAQRVTVAGLSTVGEASFEALNNLNEFRDHAIKNYKDSHGGQAPSGAELEAINKQADHIGNWSMGLNTLLLTGTNYIQFPRILGNSYKGAKLISNGAQRAENVAINQAGAAVSTIAKGIPKRIHQFRNVSSLLFSPSEAFEEGAQFAITKGTQDYFDKAYRGQDRDFFSSLQEGVSQTLNSKEGMESIFIGGLSGALSQARGNLQERGLTGLGGKQAKTRNAAIAEFNDPANYKFADYIKEGVKTINRGITLQEEQENAVKAGDIEEAKDLEHDYAHNYLTQRIKYDRYDLVKDDIADYKHIGATEEGLAQLKQEGKAAETDTIQSFQKRLGEFAEHADTVKSLYESLNIRYAGLVNKDNKKLYEPNVIDKMVYTASKIAFYDRRNNELSVDLTGAVNTQGILDKIYKGTDIDNDTEFTDLIKEVEKVDNPTKRDDLRSKLADFIETNLKRKDAIASYESLKANPEAYIEKKETTEKDEEAKTITLNTKSGEKEFIIGKEYKLGRVVQYDKSGKEVYSTPSIFVLGTNEDGTIKVKGSDGIVKNITAEQLGKYNLFDAAILDKPANKHMRFFHENWNVIYKYYLGGNKKPLTGRLQYNNETKKVEFAYWDELTGTVKTKPLQGKDTKAQKGFKYAKLQPIGKLTAKGQKAQDEFGDTEEETSADERMNILSTIIKESSDRLDKVVATIESKKKQLQETHEALENARKTSEQKTPKGNLKKIAKQALKTFNQLGTTQREIEREILSLESERDELQNTLPYFEDTLTNADTLPETTEEIITELKAQVSNLNELISHTEDAIKNGKSLLEKLEDAIKIAYSLVKEYVSKIKSLNPLFPTSIDEYTEKLEKYMGQTAAEEFVKNGEGFTPLVRALEADIAEFAEEQDVTVNQEKIDKLTDQLRELNEGLNDFIIERKAKSKLLEFFENIIAEQERLKSIEKAALENEKLNGAFFKAQKEVNKDSSGGVLAPESQEQGAQEDNNQRGPAKKDIRKLFVATAAPSKNPKPYQVRHERFLSAIDMFEDRERIKRIIVTKSNEKGLGLEGITDFVLDGYIPKAGEEPILVVYVKIDKDGISHYISQNGDKLAKAGAEKVVSFDDIIIGNLPTSNLFRLDKPTEFRYSGATPQEAAAYAEAWEKQRQAYLAMESGETVHEDFKVSRGQAIKEQAKNNIVGTLVTQEQLDNRFPLIQVVTTNGEIERVPGETIKLPPGTVVVKNGSTLEYANNRNFTPKESEHLFEVLRAFVGSASENGFNKQLTKYLQGILYFESPYKNAQDSTAVKIGRNQIFFHQGRLYLGNGGLSIPFTVESLDANRNEIITEFFQKSYNNVNNTFLKSNAPFEEVVGFDKDGSPLTKRWDSYQHFLLAPREGADPLLYTNIRPINKDIPNDNNIIGKYSYSDDLLPKTEEELQPEEVEAKPTPQAQSTVSDDPNEIRAQKEVEALAAYLMRNALENQQTEVAAIVPTDLKSMVEAAMEEDTTPSKGAVSSGNFADLLGNIASATEVAPESQNRIVTSGVYKLADMQEEKEYIESKFPFAVKIVDNIIQAGNGIQAWGTYLNGVITLSRKMEQGTGYHEAFEGVYDVMISRKEREAIQKEFVSRQGTFVDRETGKTVEYKDATIRQAKEQMAEEFRDFAMTGKKPALAKQGNVILNWFKDLWKFIQSVLSGDIQDLTDLFEKMDAGFYKNAPFKSAPGRELQTRIKTIGTFDQADTRTVIEGVVSGVFQKLFDRGQIDLINELDFSTFKPSEIYDEVKKSILDPENGSLANAGIIMKQNGVSIEEIGQKIAPIYTNIENNWKNIVDMSGELMRTFRVIQQLDSENIESEDTTYAGGRSPDSYVVDAFISDFKKNAPASIKLLINTIQESVYQSVSKVSKINEAPGPRLVTAVLDESTLMKQMVDSARMFNFTLSRLYKYNTVQEKDEQLRKLAETFPNYVRLVERLKVNKELGFQEWLLKIKFFNTFSKERPAAYVQFIYPDGTSTLGRANTTDTIDDYADSWLSKLKSERRIVKYNKSNKRWVFNGAGLYTGKTDDMVGRFQFLKQFGIPFTETQQASLSNKERTELSKAIAGIQESFRKTKIQDATEFKSLDINKRLRTIFGIFLSSQSIDPTSSYIDLEGNRTQEFILQNAVDRMKNDINNAKTREQFFEDNPQYKSVFASDSSILNSRFDSEGNAISEANGWKPLEMGYISGTKYLTDNSETITKNLTRADRLGQVINCNLNGQYYLLLPADSKTERMLKMENTIQFSDTTGSLSPAAIAKVYKYYQTEQALFQEDGKARIFSFLDPKYSLTDKQFEEAFSKFIESETQTQFDELKDYNVITGSDKSDKLAFVGLDRKFAKNNHIKPAALTEAEAKDIIRFRTANFVLNNLEIHKLFFGDPADYADPTKRYKSFLSPRETALYNSPEFDAVANREFNNVDGVQLKQGDPGYNNYSNILPTVTLQDVLSEVKELPGYEEVNGTDAQAWAPLSAMIEILLKNGARISSAQRRQFAYNSALDRLLMNQDGLYKYTNKALKKIDEDLVAQGNPVGDKNNVANTFNVIKPIVSGYDTKGGTLLDKYSIAPITYSMVRGKNLASQYKRMLDNGIKYMIVQSGRKVGNKGMDSFYDAEGNPNTAPYKAESIVEVPFKWAGIQVETGGTKRSQTFGSQYGVLATVNLMDTGVPVGWEKSPEQWFAMDEQEKIEKSKVYELVAKERGLRNAMITTGYNDLMKKLDIRDTGEGYVTGDKSKLNTLLKDELLRREVADNIKDALELDPETNDFTTPLEALPNYEMIKNIIFSYIDKYIASPKVSGGPKIQQSGSGWEAAGKRIVAKTIKDKKTGQTKTIYTSTGLKFYTKEEPWIEIMLPAWFAKKARSSGINLTDEDLLKHINESDASILEGVGFRIPTQEINSVERFKVVGFLPEEFGDTVVVPEAVTTKAGSDFDVDKLNTYLKNIYVDENNNIKAVKYFDTKEESDKFYTDVYYETIAKKVDKLDKKLVSNLNLQATLDALNSGDMKDHQYEKWADIFNQMFGEMSSSEIREQLADSLENMQRRKDKLEGVDLQSLLSDVYIERMFRAGIENEYFKTLGDILALPQNFERLVTPNTSEDLIAVAQSLEDINPNEFGEGFNRSIISPIYMNNLRHTYLVGAGGIGIAAVNQTNTSNVQKAPIYVDPKKIAGLADENEKKYIGNGIINLPHNSVTINRQKYATLSGMKDVAKRYISDKVSQYINGFVDIAKNTFLIKMGVTRNNAGTFLLLEKLGVPNDKKTPIVSYFMNQPIVRELQKALAKADTTYPFNSEIIEEVIYPMFPVNKNEDIPTRFKTPNVAIISSVAKELKAPIEKYYGEDKKTFNNEDNAFQRFILNEYLKYTVMASNLYRLTNSTNYDTAKVASPYLIHRKLIQTADAATNNIFSSADVLLNSTFKGNLKTRITNASRDISEAFFKFIHPSVRKYTDPIITELSRRIRNDQDYEKAARKVEQSFIDYLVVGASGLSTRTRELMINDETAFANRLRTVAQYMQSHPKSKIAKNAILKQLVAADIKQEGDTQIVKLLQKASDAYTSNIYTEAMRELRDGIKTAELYKSLVRVAFLQSGIGTSPISFTDIIPSEDFTKFILPALERLKNEPLLRGFIDTDSFYKNNWKNTDIVPKHMKKRSTVNKTPQLETLLLSNGIDPENWEAYRISTKSPSFGSKYITLDRYFKGITDEEIAERKSKKIPYMETVLLKRLEEKPGVPYTAYYNIKKHDGKFGIYTPINALGDGYKGVEYYDHIRSSVYNNNTYKPIGEVDNNSLLRVLTGRQTPKQEENDPFKCK